MSISYQDRAAGRRRSSVVPPDTDASIPDSNPTSNSHSADVFSDTEAADANAASGVGLIDRPAKAPIEIAAEPWNDTYDAPKEQDEAAAWAAEREARYAAGIDWPTVIWITLLHIGALAAPFTFTWTGLIVFIVFQYLTGSVGICLGYHRLLTHKGFQCSGVTRFMLAFIGGLAGEGSAIFWVANHRKHHCHSDHVGDPHSPLDGEDGPIWAHMGWLVPRVDVEGRDEFFKRWAPDLLREPGMAFLDYTFLLWHILLGAAMFATGYFMEGWELGLSLVVWGMFVRLVYVLHVTWFVNSATHMWGYRTYETDDHSTNLWWVGILAFGEGWHNNHHAYPRMAVHGHQWWEFDLTWNVLRVMRFCGLAWDIVDYKQKHKREEE
jgi:fatty-acid desaturase